KVGGHADLFVVGRGQAQHDLTDGNKLLRALLVLQNGVAVFHYLGTSWVFGFLCAGNTVDSIVPFIVRHFRFDCKKNPAPPPQSCKSRSKRSILSTLPMTVMVSPWPNR